MLLLISSILYIDAVHDSSDEVWSEGMPTADRGGSADNWFERTAPKGPQDAQNEWERQLRLGLVEIGEEADEAEPMEFAAIVPPHLVAQHAAEVGVSVYGAEPCGLKCQEAKKAEEDAQQEKIKRRNQRSPKCAQCLSELRTLRTLFLFLPYPYVPLHSTYN